jgi:hypothetical protein
VWRKRLATAELAYRDSSLELRNALRGNPESSPEVAEARERKSQARQEYLRILRIFTDLILRGKVPREGPSSEEP